MKIGFLNRLRLLAGTVDAEDLVTEYQRSFKKSSSEQEIEDNDLAKQVQSGRVKVAPPRSSEPDISPNISAYFNDKVPVEPGFQFEVIEEIRCLALNNASVSQALNNIINLANTGHTLKFDSKVKNEDAIKMNKHIQDNLITWHYGVADGNALASKLFMQAFISGAVCSEVILDDDLKGVKRVTLPKPESIRFVYNKREATYEPYQVRKNSLGLKNIDENGLVKLNPASFKYYTLNTDLEAPYGYPPYLPAIPMLKDQKLMLANISFIIQQIGIVGFLELLMDKPDQRDGESDTQYAARLTAYLDDTKKNLSTSMRDGIVVGYKEDHEFQFHSASKNAAGVSDLFMQNEIMVHSGLKQDPMLSGKKSGAGEGYITVIFTKLISELRNVQSIVAKVLKHYYELELRLAGYSFSSLDVEFKPSTIQDDLKLQQAIEIKIRNSRQLWVDGIISKDEYARRIGQEKAHNQKTPEQIIQEQAKSTGDPNLDAQKKAVREKSKDVSDKKVRDKNKTGSATKQNNDE